MNRRLLILGCIALTAACASSPQREVTDPRDRDPNFRYGTNAGTSPVGTIPDALLKDATRDRAVKVTIEYPTRGGPHPVIILSHANTLSNRSYPGLTAHWASYGYVVIRPAHLDTPSPDDLTVAEWRTRARDVSAVIDALPALPAQYPELEGKLDSTRIGVAGHARGAVTAMMLGGVRVFPGPVSFADSRVKAIVAMSPAGPMQQWGLTNESFSELRVPALFLSGSGDTGTGEGETPEWRQQAFELAPAGDKWLILLEGIRTGTFTGQAGPLHDRAVPITADVPIDPRIDPNAARRPVYVETPSRARPADVNQRALFISARALALAFFDTYLKGETGGREFLEQADARETVVVKRK